MKDSYFEALVVLRDANEKAYALTKHFGFKSQAAMLNGRIKRERLRRINEVRQ